MSTIIDIDSDKIQSNIIERLESEKENVHQANDKITGTTSSANINRFIKNRIKLSLYNLWTNIDNVQGYINDYLEKIKENEKKYEGELEGIPKDSLKQIIGAFDHLFGAIPNNINPFEGFNASAVEYTVVEGDTLEKIAKENGVSVEELLKYNDIEGTVINVGDVIIIPKNIFVGVQEVISEETGEELKTVNENQEQVYIISSGDTLAKIAERFGCTVEELAALNGIENVDAIYAGQELKIPGISDSTYDQSNEDISAVHVVKSGDTLGKIANENGCTVDDLMRVNPQIKDKNSISIGEEIIIPSESQQSSNNTDSTTTGSNTNNNASINEPSSNENPPSPEPTNEEPPVGMTDAFSEGNKSGNDNQDMSVNEPSSNENPPSPESTDEPPEGMVSAF